MPTNEEQMTDLPKKITDLVEELANCRKRALEIELQLSVIDEALRKVRSDPRPAGRPRGRPRKVPLSEQVVTRLYGEPVAIEEFDGNTAA